MLWGVIGAVGLNWLYRSSNNAFLIALGFGGLLLVVYRNILSNLPLVTIMLGMITLIGWLITPQLRALPIEPLFARELWFAGLLGIVWMIFSAPLLAWSIANQTRALAVRRGFTARWLYALVGVGLVALSGWIVITHGLQNCRWLDRALDRSGCYAAIPLSTFNDYLQVSTDGTIYNIGDEMISRIDPTKRQATVIFRLPNTNDQFITGAVLSPDATLLALTTQGELPTKQYTHSLVLVRTSDGTLQHTIPLTDEVAGMFPRFRLDNQAILVYDQAWNVADGQHLGTVTTLDQGDYQGRWYDQFNNGETTLYADTGDSDLTKITLLRQTELHTITKLELQTPSWDFRNDRVAFSPQGQLIALVRTAERPDFSNISRVDVWNTNDGTLRQTITIPESQAWGIRAVPSERLNSLVIATDKEIQLYRLR